MHGRSSLQCLFLASVLAAWIAPSWAASADETSEIEETQRWVPSVGIIWGIFGQDSEASSVTSSLTGSNPPAPARPATSGSQVMLAPFAGGSFELMSPRLHESGGRPRLFAHVDGTAAMGFSYDIAKEGEPGTLIPPSFPVPEAEVAGQGSKTEAQAESAILTGGAGVAFAVALGDWRFRIKPSVEYMREEIEVKGTISRAVTRPPIPPPPGASTDFRLIDFAGSKTKTFHGIGPGLEIELDAARIENFAITVFLSGQAYALLGGRDVDFSDSHTDAIGTETASWHFRRDRWLYRSSMGIRFRWLPDWAD